MTGSTTLRHFLHHLRADTPLERAAELSGMSLGEARLTLAAEQRGELADVEELDPDTPKETVMTDYTTTISTNGGPQVPVDFSKGLDHPENAAAREVMATVVRGAIGHNQPEETMSEGNVAADELRLLIERIERLEEDKKDVNDDIKDVYGEAKARGYDPKTMRRLVRLRKMEKNARDEAAALLETYASALGMQGVLL